MRLIRLQVVVVIAMLATVSRSNETPPRAAEIRSQLEA